MESTLPATDRHPQNWMFALAVEATGPLIVAAIAFAGYAISFAYQMGYCRYFGVDWSLIEVSFGRAIVVGIFALFYFSVIVLIAMAAYLIAERTNKNVITKLGMLYGVMGAILSITLDAGFWIAILLGSSLVPFAFAWWFQDVQNGRIQIQGLLAIVVFASLAIAAPILVLIGHERARAQTRFLQMSGANCVLVSHGNGSLIFAAYEAANNGKNTLSGRIRIVPAQKEVELRSIQVGPLLQTVDS